MKNREYRPRMADALLKEMLRSFPAILVQGPKWCGKTTTAEQQAASILYLADPLSLEKNKLLAETNINALLTGETPHLIDE